MEAMLMKEQVRPGDETQFMHAIFASDEEMMTFYLTLNRFVNPVTYFMQRSDGERLENLLYSLGQLQNFTSLFKSYHSDGVRQLIEGFGLHMMQTTFSNRERRLAATNVGFQMKFLIDVMKESNHTTLLYKIYQTHIQNVKYLLEKMKDSEESIL